MRVRASVMTLFGILLAGCQTVETTSYVLNPTDISSQSVKLNQNTHSAFVVSRRARSIVAVSLSPESSWKEYGTTFSVKVKNTGKQPVSFGASAIVVANGENRAEVLDYAGIQRVIKDKQNAAQAAAVFSAVAGGVGAGLYASSPQANPVVASVITQNVVASVQATQVNLVNTNAEADVLSTESANAFITDISIPRGGTVGGIVVVRQISGPTANLTITIDSDVHSFVIASQ